MTSDTDTVTVPTRALVRRLTRDLTQRDHLLSLLAEVSEGHVLTNRLGEAVLLVPETVLADIRQAIGAEPSPEDTPSPQETSP